MSESEWISVTEAAQMLGYAPNYFRRAFCMHPMNGLTVMVIRKPGKLLLRYRVLRADVVALMDSSKKAS